jgi:hypothetical protein
MVANFSEEALTIPKGMIFGVAQEVSGNLVFSTEVEESSDRSTEQALFQETGDSYLSGSRDI